MLLLFIEQDKKRKCINHRNVADVKVWPNICIDFGFSSYVGIQENVCVCVCECIIYKCGKDKSKTFAFLMVHYVVYVNFLMGLCNGYKETWFDRKTCFCLSMHYALKNWDLFNDLMNEYGNQRCKFRSSHFSEIFIDQNYDFLFFIIEVVKRTLAQFYF